MKSLIGNQKQIRILIADQESAILDKVYTSINEPYSVEGDQIKKSITEIDDFIKNNFPPIVLDEIKTKLTIKYTNKDIFLESFSFVDSGNNQGKAYFMLITPHMLGPERPPFYIFEREDPDLYRLFNNVYEHYYSLGTKVWPN